MPMHPRTIKATPIKDVALDLLPSSFFNATTFSLPQLGHQGNCLVRVSFISLRMRRLCTKSFLHTLT